MLIKDESLLPKKIDLISHRGYIGYSYSENLASNLELFCYPDFYSHYFPEIMDICETAKMIDRVELDFRVTKDDEWVCSHSKFCGLKLIKEQTLEELESQGLLSLEDIMLVLIYKKGILFDIKSTFSNGEITTNALFRLFEQLNKYITLFDHQIQSFDETLVKCFINARRCGELGSHIGIGQVISRMNKDKFSKNSNCFSGIECEELDFISLSSEVWEGPIIGKNYALYRDKFAKAKFYAWTWSPPHLENESRIINFVEKGADGIIASNPDRVKKYLKKHLF